MRITDKTKLEYPVNDTCTAQHNPLERSVFELNYKVLALTHAEIGRVKNHNLASIIVRDRRDEDGQLINSEALLAEIERSTWILAPSATGYDLQTVNEALQKGVIDQDDWRELESNLIFFTACYYLFTKAQREAMMGGLMDSMGLSIISSEATAAPASLETSTQGNPSGLKKVISSGIS